MQGFLGFKISQMFTYRDEKHFQIIDGYTMVLGKKMFEDAWDGYLKDTRFIKMALGDDYYRLVRPRYFTEGLEEIGSRRVGFTGILVVNSDVKLDYEWVMFRRGNMGAEVMSVHMEGDRPDFSAAELARLLDKRMQLAQAAAGGSQAGATPKP
jgi:hypothetical protein